LQSCLAKSISLTNQKISNYKESIMKRPKLPNLENMPALKGNGGNNVIRGKNKNGRLYGFGGNDVLYALGGHDVLFGGSGNDTLEGGTGNDFLFGDAGADTLNGGKGNDVLFGGIGNDSLDGGEGNDFLFGGSGDDALEGGKGNDFVFGGSGDDTLDWDDGDGNDLMSGGSGYDTIEVKGSVEQGDVFTLGAAVDEGKLKAIFKRENLVPFTLTVDTSEKFEVSGLGGDDTFTVNNLTGTDVQLVQFFGNEGNDVLEAGNTSTLIYAEGGVGNDKLVGGSANDTLYGGEGDDFIEGEKGNDTMIGEAGNDRLVWDDGEGSDLISGGEGTDIVEVNASTGKDDVFTLVQDGANAIFDRINVGLFTLTTDTAEQFEVNADAGNDIFIVEDLSNTAVDLITFKAGDGNDILDGSATKTALIAYGEAGDDTLIGGANNDYLDGGAGIDTIVGNGGNDVIVGGAEVDILTGGTGADQFRYGGDVLTSGPDELQDYDISADQYGLKGQDLGINALTFQKGTATEITGDVNVIVLAGEKFANAKAAANAIAANDNITSGAGVFVYFNQNLGISRLVYSQDLGSGGPINVLANMRNQSGDTGFANLDTFAQANFTLV
jgi:Ca2+-binding RTX toxin-like protein